MAKVNDHLWRDFIPMELEGTKESAKIVDIHRSLSGYTDVTQAKTREQFVAQVGTAEGITADAEAKGAYSALSVMDIVCATLISAIMLGARRFICKVFYGGPELLRLMLSMVGTLFVRYAVVKPCASNPAGYELYLLGETCQNLSKDELAGLCKRWESEMGTYTSVVGGMVPWSDDLMTFCTKLEGRGWPAFNREIAVYHKTGPGARNKHGLSNALELLLPGVTVEDLHIGSIQTSLIQCKAVALQEISESRKMLSKIDAPAYVSPSQGQLGALEQHKTKAIPRAITCNLCDTLLFLLQTDRVTCKDYLEAYTDLMSRRVIYSVDFGRKKRNLSDDVGLHLALGSAGKGSTKIVGEMFPEILDSDFDLDLGIAVSAQVGFTSKDNVKGSPKTVYDLIAKLSKDYRLTVRTAMEPFAGLGGQTEGLVNKLITSKARTTHIWSYSERVVDEKTDSVLAYFCQQQWLRWIPRHATYSEIVNETADLLLLDPTWVNADALVFADRTDPTDIADLIRVASKERRYKVIALYIGAEFIRTPIVLGGYNEEPYPSRYSSKEAVMRFWVSTAFQRVKQR